MAESYPYIISNNKIEPILAKIRAAAKPDKFTIQFLRSLGFTASNDRAMVRVLKELGFLNDGGVPTEKYDRLRDKTDWQFVLGEQVKELYADLYAINTEIHKAADDDVKGAISRVTGQDGKSVARYFSTFKALTGLAKFEEKQPRNAKAPTPEPLDAAPANPVRGPALAGSGTGFHYNIQIHLPATTDISVYNAIFASLRDHLLG